MIMIDMIATGANIKKMRIDAGMTIADITDACGITAGAVCKWQRGDAMPALDNIVVLAAVFGVTVDAILVYKDDFRLQVSA